MNYMKSSLFHSDRIDPDDLPVVQYGKSRWPAWPEDVEEAVHELHDKLALKPERGRPLLKRVS